MKLKRTKAEKALVQRARIECPSTKGGVKWEDAFAIHPDWPQKLRADTEHGRKLLKQLTARMIQNGSINLPTNGHLESPAPAKPSYSSGLPHCPGCGMALAAWNRAYNEMMTGHEHDTTNKR